MSKKPAEKKKAKTKEEEMAERVARAKVANELKRKKTIEKQIKHIEKVRDQRLKKRDKLEETFNKAVKGYDQQIENLKKSLKG